MNHVMILNSQENELKLIASKIEQYDHNIMITTYRYSEPFLSDFKKLEYLPILIISVVLDNENGIDIAKKILKINPNVPIIFFSSDLHVVLDIYDVKHCYHIYKTQFEKRLPLAIACAKEMIKKQQQNLILQLKNKKMVLPLKNILYLEREKRITHIYCLNDKQVDTSKKLRELMPCLSDDFVRCHASYIANFNHLKEIQRTQLILNGDIIIPVSRSHAAMVNEALTYYLKR